MSLQKISTQFTSYLSDLPFYTNKNTRVLLFTIGAGYLLYKAANLLTNTLSSLLQFDKDLEKRYGAGTWAVVTGASDGIGKAFAFELAKRRFNIVLIGRNEEKLKGVEKELLQKHPLTQTRIVVKDFSQSSQEGFAEEIYNQIGDLDISILVNNAGQGKPGYYKDMEIFEIRDLVLVNCLSHALITRVLLPKLAGRTQRSAIINIASTCASYPRPILQVYSATKVFHDFLSRGLAYEHPNIDILSMKPGGVATKMTNKRGIAPEEFVNISLKALGSTSETHGHWKHVWSWATRSSIPEVFKPMFFRKVFNMK